MAENHKLAVPKEETERKHPLNRFPPQVINWTVLTLSVLFTLPIILFGVNYMKDKYQNARQNAYDEYYQPAYDWAEERNHVSNYVLVSVDGAREVSRLEVLTVNDSVFITKNADKTEKTTSWLEVQGTGVFTVDLSAGEFIVDSERQYVLVRVPNPALTECTASGTGKSFVQNGKFLSNGSIAEGVRLVQAQKKEGQIKLEDAMRQSRYFHEAAQNAAKLSIEAIVKKWNPDVPDLQVEVEFITDD